MKLRMIAFWIAAALATAAAQSPPREAAGNWPQFRGNPRLTGVATTAPLDSLKLLWSYETGDSIDSSAAIADGVVYVGVGNGDLLVGCRLDARVTGGQGKVNAFLSVLPCER